MTSQKDSQSSSSDRIKKKRNPNHEELSWEKLFKHSESLGLAKIVIFLTVSFWTLKA